MRVHQKISANIFLVIIILMMAFGSMPHLVHDHYIQITHQTENAVRSNESVSITHSIFHIIEAMSKAHASSHHWHNATQTKASDRVSSVQYISLLLIFIPLMRQVFSVKEKAYCIYTKPILYKGRFASAWALRGPPSHI